MEELKYDDSQLKAINLCTSDIRIVAVSGSAGCGKTTIMRTAYNLLTNNGFNCVMCAPTGKAARRITQATDIQAMTIHKLLEFPSPKDVDETTGQPLTPGVPQRNKKNPLEFNCVLIDEAPMVSYTLMRYIYEALPVGGIIRLFGDMNQLPPVEDTHIVAPFWSILNKVSSQGSHGTVLTKIYRQDGSSGILDGSRKIVEGRYPKNTEDFRLITTSDHVTSLKKVLANSACPDFRLLTNQIISPMRKYKSGTIILNEIVRNIYNSKPEKSIKIARHSWDEKRPLIVGINDKVVMNKNWYDIGSEGLMNGEVGIIKDITSWGDVVVDFDGEIITIPSEIETKTRRGDVILNPQKDLELAYVLTTHKAQGSEYDHVIFCIDTSHKYVLFRNNFYTAVTRARKSVHVLYAPSAMSRALARDPIYAPKGSTH